MPLLIEELDRFAAPTPEPHSIGVDGETVYVASRATKNIDVIDRRTWTKTDEIVPPGMPWGMNFGEGTLLMTCGEGEDDTRRIHRFTPGAGFAPGAVACPDDAGSHLAFYAGRVLLGQWYNKQLLLLDDNGSVRKTYHSPHQISGVAVVGDVAYLLTTDDEDHGEYWITRLILSDPSREAEDIALVPFHGRGLAYDGTDFWTNYRSANQTIRFRLPA